jgi:hypothetical protein
MYPWKDRVMKGKEYDRVDYRLYAKVTTINSKHIYLFILQWI